MNYEQVETAINNFQVDQDGQALFLKHWGRLIASLNEKHEKIKSECLKWRIEDAMGLWNGCLSRCPTDAYIKFGSLGVEMKKFWEAIDDTPDDIWCNFIWNACLEISGLCTNVDTEDLCGVVDYWTRKVQETDFV